MACNTEIVSFYAPNERQQAEEGLLKSLDVVSCPMHIAGLPAFDSTEAQRSHRPEFIYSRMMRTDKPACWVMPGARFLQDPAEMFDQLERANQDVALLPVGKLKDGRDAVSAAAVWVNNTLNGLVFVCVWMSMCLSRQDVDPGVFLWPALKTAEEVTVALLPRSMAVVAGTPDEERAMLLHPVL